MRRRAIVVTSVAILAVACGIDALGTLGADAIPGRDGGESDGSPVDAPVVPDDGGGEGDASSDGDVDAPTEAGRGCDAGSITIADGFAMLDGGSWFKVSDGSNFPYPQIDPSSDGPGASLVNPTMASSLGALWLPRTVPLHAFDVSFRYVMTCDAGCSDGFSIAWLEATDAGQAALNGYIVAKASFGLPQLLRGAAVAFDVHQDAITGDPAAPDLSLLALDGAVPGTYDWHSKTSARPNMTGTHAVSLRLRKGVIEVRVDGTLVQSGPVASRFDGWFGFAGSSGDAVGTFVVRAFSGTFYACDDP